MNTTELGKRIKEARIAKKMTQSEVVGTFITRNMLSQIESGTASPSIKTLEYLSKALDIPMNQLMSDDDTTDASFASADNHNYPSVSSDIMHLYINCKQSFREGNYYEAIHTLEACLDAQQKNEPEPGLTTQDTLMSDEISALLAISCYKLATSIDTSKAAAENKNDAGASAITYAKKAIHYSSKGIFSSMELKTKSMLLLEELLNRQLSDNQ